MKNAVFSKMAIGVYGISSQSGRASFADFTDRGYKVVGYARSTEHGRTVLDAICSLGGLYIERPENTNHELSHFVPLGESLVTDDLSVLIEQASIIIIALPSIYHEEAVAAMTNAGLGQKQVPIVLSPSRSVAAPYMWRSLGEGYPLICFSTCPYSCKAPKSEVAFIKRRKRTFIASLEGNVTGEHVNLVRKLFPQAALTRIPALTSLNNIGAVFHCATYMLNIDEIERRKASGELFSFYIDGIASRPEVGKVLEQIDQVRLKIANAIGINTFGLKENPREDIWRKLTNALRALEEESADDIDILRHIRKEFTEFLGNCVVSAQHWLDITYGVFHIEGESLSEAIGRTPTYQGNSVPQLRYITEDIPTGLVAFEALAEMLDIDATVCAEIIEQYDGRFRDNIRVKGRNLRDFDKDYVLSYLKGNYNA